MISLSSCMASSPPYGVPKVATGSGWLKKDLTANTAPTTAAIPTTGTMRRPIADGGFWSSAMSSA